MTIRSFLGAIARRITAPAGAPVAPPAPVSPAPAPQTLNVAVTAPAAAVAEPPPADFAKWLAAQFSCIDYLGPAELDVLDRHFSRAIDDTMRIAFAKDIVAFFTAHPEKFRLVGASRYYLERQPSIAVQVAFIAANYVIGQSARCLEIAERLATTWPNVFTQVLLARVNEDALGAAAEHRVLTAALAAYPDDATVRLNLIENLIATNRVEEANRAVTEIRPLVERMLAEEITVATVNQKALDAAIQTGKRSPDADDDIYTDEMCRNNWMAYYESFVTRRERQHGDRMVLNRFVGWVRTVADEVEVVLDFGTLCAQPLFEAAQAAPRVRFIGTDRQQFIADLNREAYPLPNLSFDHGDIFEVMERTARLPGRKALVHIRTTCTLYPRFVEELYAAAARLGYEHIYLVENAGFVRTRLAFMPFETMQESALVTKHRLHLHNYRAVLTAAGYRIHDFTRNRAPGLWRGEHPANFLGSQYELHAKLGGV